MEGVISDVGTPSRILQHIILDPLANFESNVKFVIFLTLFCLKGHHCRLHVHVEKKYYRIIKQHKQVLVSYFFQTRYLPPENTES